MTSPQQTGDAYSQYPHGSPYPYSPYGMGQYVPYQQPMMGYPNYPQYSYNQIPAHYPQYGYEVPSQYPVQQLQMMPEQPHDMYRAHMPHSNEAGFPQCVPPMEKPQSLVPPREMTMPRVPIASGHVAPEIPIEKEPMFQVPVHDSFAPVITDADIVPNPIPYSEQFQDEYEEDEEEFAENEGFGEYPGHQEFDSVLHHEDLHAHAFIGDGFREGEMNSFESVLSKEDKDGFGYLHPNNLVDPDVFTPNEVVELTAPVVIEPETEESLKQKAREEAKRKKRREAKKRRKKAKAAKKEKEQKPAEPVVVRNVTKPLDIRVGYQAGDTKPQNVPVETPRFKLNHVKPGDRPPGFKFGINIERRDGSKMTLNTA